MNINKHNYQEFLLLYVDGELNTLEMQFVDEYVAANLFAKEELELLMDTKLTSINNNVETVEFNKESLFKFEKETINEFNYPAYFVEYVNDELNKKDKISVENFANSNPILLSEFNLYQQTKLLPDTSLVFKNKEILLKKEEKTRIIFLNWKQFAAAAILLGAMFTGFILTNKSAVDNELVNSNKTNPVIKEGIKKSNNETNNQVVVNITEKENLSKKSNSINFLDSKKMNITNITPFKNVVDSKNNITKQSSIKPSNIPTPFIENEKKQIVANNNIQVIKNEEIVANINTPKTIQKEETNTASLTKSSLTETEATLSKTIVYKTLDIDAENDNSVNVGNLLLNKQKVNVVLQKVGKIFGKSKRAQLEDMASSTASL